jgi:hypothetical protein
LKKGEDIFSIAKNAEKRYGGSFKVINNNLYREDEKDLKLILKLEKSK